MCGIAGFFSGRGATPEGAQDILRRMGSVLAHRGPDDEGEYLTEGCGLASRRLAIIDLVQGRQPMFSPSGRTVLVYNGEVYNFKDLKKELEGAGVVFKTKSDSEVILAGYEKWGEDVLSRLRGMFAFALYDIPRRRLFLARDHTGIKPLYYTTQDGFFIFASEIKALLQFPGMRAGLNPEGLPKYLSFLWVPAPETLFKNVRILEPGQAMVLEGQSARSWRYWNPELREHDQARSEEEWVALVDSELRRAVTEQLVSDVPLGAFLSGGLDSSTVVAYAHKSGSEPLITYTTGFAKENIKEDVILSDLQYARKAARHLHVRYHELILSPNVVELLPKLTWHMDEPPADPAAVTTYLICKAAKETCTVMLSGMGGDEVFGGYPRYLANWLADKYRILPRPLREVGLKPGLLRIPTGSNSFIRNLKKFLKSADLPLEDRYLGYLSYYTEPELRKLLKADFHWNDIYNGHREIFRRYRTGDDLQSMMNLDLMTFLPFLNLMYTDKMSSAASVEVRVPFLDHMLIEKAARIPGRLKMKNGRRKYILKKTAERSLPFQIVWRKKAGFGAPIGAWLKTRARDMMFDLLSEDMVKKRGYFHFPAIRKLIQDHLTGREYNANQLWQLMTFELWHQKFLD